MNFHELTAEELLGPLNDVEKKYAPRHLFAAGDLSFVRDNARVSIVGSRKASPHGLRRAAKLAALLAEREIVVVSGLAEGIDTAAHTSCIQKNGRTVAVIGTPLENCYPKENEALQHKIMEEHLCISQFAAGTPIQRQNFPMRNRAMALISDATVIIEAGDTSGSLSQGWEALRLGRELFISKATVENNSLKWPSEMIGYGAKILSDENLSEFFESLPERRTLATIYEVPF